METDQPQTFGALLRRYRRAAGLSQEQLAERAGLTAQAVSTLERGFRRTPYRDTVHVLARALALPPTEAAALEVAVGRGRAGTPGARTPPRSALPLPLTALVGRAQEVADVVALLQPAVDGSGQGRVRLLTLTGPGGVGKTRLALQAAHLLAGRYPHGAAFVDLAPLRDPALVEATIAQALQVEEGAGRSLSLALRLHLRDRHLLLLLDNVEHVVAAAPLLAELLAACPGVRVMATSRARLRLSGEQTYAVQPLPVPDPGRLPALADLARVPAVELLVQRARAAAPGFALQEANATAMAALCVHLDGLPLALELAAARLSVLSPGLLLRRLAPRLPLLTGGARDLPERQQTLRATLDWSYALLGPDAQAVFRRLCVFAGGCTLEAAEAVCGGGLQEPAAVLAGLEALVDHGLLRRTAATGTGEGRFVLLETLREYGRERLDESGETAALRRGHAAYLVALAEEAEPALAGADQAVWLARLHQEHDNVRAALGWSLEEGGDTALGLRLAAALGQFWALRGYLGEGRGWLEALLAASPPLPDLERTAWAARGRAVSAAGSLASHQGDYARARTLHGEALALRDALGDARDRAASLHNLGWVAVEQGDYARATALLGAALAARRALGDAAGSALSLRALGWMAAEQGDYARATPLLGEALALQQALGDTRAIATALEDLGWIAQEQGEYARATALLQEALALQRALGDAFGTAYTLDGLALVAHGEGEHARAMALLAEALALAQTGGRTQAVAVILADVARVAAARGRWVRAAQVLGAAEAARERAVIRPGPVGLAYDRRTAATLRAALGEDAFAAAWSAGSALPPEQAVALALDDRLC